MWLSYLRVVLVGHVCRFISKHCLLCVQQRGSLLPAKFVFNDVQCSLAGFLAFTHTFVNFESLHTRHVKLTAKRMLGEPTIYDLVYGDPPI